MSFQFAIGEATRDEILIHLRDCDTSFSPALSTRTNLAAYAEKIVGRAVTFEAWTAHKLVGLVACYFNDPDTQEGFITSVSTMLDAQGKGCARRLMVMAMDYAARNGFKAISLEVASSNLPALNLYHSLGFRELGLSGGIIQMTCANIDHQTT